MHGGWITLVLFFISSVLVVSSRFSGNRPRKLNRLQQVGSRDSPRRCQAGEEWLNPFLPDYIIPRHYDLWLNPNHYNDGSTYEGQVDIQLEILETTQTILVHYKDMTISLTGLRDDTGAVLPLLTAVPYDPNEYWVVQTVEFIPAGSNVTLTLHFSGSLTNGIVGFYKSTYTNDITGIESWLATTKFQPSDARKAFPCFDEPRFRSTFTITTRHWSNFTALANMPSERTVELDDEWSETTFQTSPSMSSYLVCFIVHDFPYKSNTLQDGTPHKVWSRPDRLDQVDYALWASPIIQDYFVDLFNVPYPLPKLDQVGIPDYPSGATEHWGLITYRETRLLYDPVQVSDYDKQRVLSIIGHELAHNHVGNLVTCHYWDEIWLNEGFAVYYSIKGVVHADSTMYADGQFFTRTVQSVLGDDSMNSSRPVVVKISSPDEANAAFDGIAYNKGAALLSMMEGFLGSETFNSGVSRYLLDNAFSTVISDDLWAAMQQEVGSSLNIKEVMSPWVYSMGYPVVDITRITGHRFDARQRRFLLDPTSDPESPPTEYGYKWFIPLNYRTMSGTTGTVWLNMTDEIFEIPEVIDESEWVKFNYDHTGFYRVNYPLEMWALIEQQLLNDHTMFTDLERANLLSDVMALSRAAHLHYDTALDMTKYLDLELDFLPWDSIYGPLMHISNMLYNNQANYQLWQTYVVQVSYQLMDKLQVADFGTYIEKLTRTNLIQISCDNGYAACLTNTTNLFVDWLADSELNAIANNLKREVYSFGMWSTGDEQSWDTVWTRYQTATSGQEQNNLLYSLTRTQDLTLIDRLLGYSMDESQIRSQDFFTVISYISSNRVANDHLWNWVQVNYDAILARFGLSNRSLSRMVPGIVTNYNTQEQLQEVEDFFALYPDAGPGERSREEALQNIRANILWVDSNLDTILDWLNNNITPN